MNTVCIQLHIVFFQSFGYNVGCLSDYSPFFFFFFFLAEYYTIMNISSSHRAFLWMDGVYRRRNFQA